MPSPFQITQQPVSLLDLETLSRQYIPDETDTKHGYKPFNLSKLQSYNPIYHRLFPTISVDDAEKVAPDVREQVCGLDKTLVASVGTGLQRNIHYKFAPLLDPMRYVIGKYDLADPALKTLPTVCSDTQTKLTTPHNSSYVDAFFVYLSSKLLRNHDMVHGLDYYGSFLGIQEKFRLNIADDLEYLHDSEYFMQHNGKEFVVAEYIADTAEFTNCGSRGNRRDKLHIGSESNVSVAELDFAELDSAPLSVTPETAPASFAALETAELDTDAADVMELDARSETESNDSAEEHTDDEEDMLAKNPEDDIKDNDGIANEDESVSEYETVSDSDMETSGYEDTPVYCYINEFPVQMICLEKCENTLESLMLSGEVDDTNAAAYLTQIIMSLIVYKHTFELTHNDLHTNNIMYISTELEYLFYKYNGKTYRVPTYGKIFKIIDFGRAIYHYKGMRFCSDSFAPGGDAHTQYNTEPFLDDTKARIEPNDSFDLCRLGCAIYDMIIPDVRFPVKKMDEFQRTINRWCLDDGGKNVLYKKSGEERYPDFKLYKMIARHVHKHTPAAQLSHSYFNQFLSEVSGDNVLDIDALPRYA